MSNQTTTGRNRIFGIVTRILSWEVENMRKTKEEIVMEKKMRMKDISSISPLGCIIEHLYWMFIIFLNYKNLTFIPLNDYSVASSRRILIACMVIASIIGIVLRWRRCMTTRGVIADLMIGVGIYTIMAYKGYYAGWIKVLSIIYFVFFISYAILVFLRRSRGKSILNIRNRNRKCFIIISRTIRMMNVAGLVLGLIMFVLIIPITYNRFFRGGIIVADVKQSSFSGFDINYTENEWGLTYNIDSISKIRSKESWEPLTSKQKLAVLQDICNCECNYWGMDFQVTIVMDDLKEGTLGSYCHSERRIVIDKQHIENDAPEEILDTVLHEMYHGWEMTLISLYLDASESQKKMRVFQHCEEYIKELTNYQDGGDDFESYMRYYCQFLEKDSRQYARDAVKEYYDEIDLILEE